MGSDVVFDRSDPTGCVIEPRKVTERGADAVNRAEGYIACILLA